MARYSLANYILTVTIPTELAGTFGANTLTVGGEGSYLDSMQVSLSQNLWSTEGDSTGSWVHNKNLDRTGTCQITLSMLSDKVARFITLCNLYYAADSDYSGLTLELSSSDGTTIATCNDCYITKIPDQQFQSTAQRQTWEFTCGRITIH